MGIYRFIILFFLGLCYLPTAFCTPFIKATSAHTHIKSFNTYPVTVWYEGLSDLATTIPIVVSLKDPNNNGKTYASQFVLDYELNGWEKVSVSVGELPDCTCVWEIRLASDINDIYGKYDDIHLDQVQVYYDDSVSGVYLSEDVIVPASSVEVRVQYNAWAEREIWAEVITGNSETYSKVVTHVERGSGEVSLSLPVSRELPPSSTPYISVKLLPPGAKWHEYYDQKNKSVQVDSSIDQCSESIVSLGDKDFDGIPDCAELPGNLYFGEYYFDLGARIGQRDLFVEVDWMATEDLGVIPQFEAFRKVREVFLRENYAIHFDLGNLYSSASLDVENFNLGGGGPIPFVKTLQLPSSDNVEVASVIDLKDTYMKETRRVGAPFYYMVFGSSQLSSGAAGPSGRAYVFGRYSMITLGNWRLSKSDQESINQLINIQASTIMHEFGHNLGLKHGGDEDTNRKPNYLSVMNYDYQQDGLPVIGENEGDRLLNRLGGDLCSGELKNGPRGSYESFRIDYSHGTSINLVENDEAPLLEGLGFGRQGSKPIDFNCNGFLFDEIISLDLNGDGVKNTLKDYNDWANIQLFFYGAAGDGIDPDEREISEEEVPPKSFFDTIRAR